MRPARYRLAAVLGVTATVLVAISDRLIGIPREAKRHASINLR